MKKKGIVGLLAAGAAAMGYGVYKLVKGDENHYAAVDPVDDVDYEDEIETDVVDEESEN